MRVTVVRISKIHQIARSFHLYSLAAALVVVLACIILVEMSIENLRLIGIISTIIGCVATAATWTFARSPVARGYPTRAGIVRTLNLKLGKKQRSSTIWASIISALFRQNVVRPC